MSIDLSNHSIIAWIVKNAIKTENGKPYDLKSHLFWYNVLTDRSPNIVLLKAAQTGGSTTMGLKMLWSMKKFGLNIAYTAPTDSDAQEFVSGKLNPIIRQNPVIHDWIADTDSVQQKRLGENSAYFRGTMTERAALSFSSDLNIHDEVDRSNRLIIAQYASRLQHSKYKWEWLLSNPSVRGNGVDEFWQKSNKQHWFISCKKCNKKQYLSWPDSICEERKAFVCKYCDEVLSDEDRRSGDWHAQVTETVPKFSGYWVSLLMAPWVTAAEIIELNRTKTPDYFANFVLGLPYESTSGKLNEDQFFMNLTEDPYPLEHPIVIGVDTGLPNWYVVGNRHGLFTAGKCDGYKEIAQMLDRWPRAIAVIDQGGDLHGSRELQANYPGRVFLCYYRQDRKAMTLADWGSGEEQGKVVADRNRLLQTVMDEFRARLIPLRGTKDDWWELWTHIANMYRVVEEDALGQERFVWQRSGADHLFHAVCYWRLGLEKFGFSTPKTVGQPVKVHAAPSFTVDPLTKTVKASDVFVKRDEEHDWRHV